MKKIISAILSIVLLTVLLGSDLYSATGGSGQGNGLNPLVSAPWLKDNLGKVEVLDVRDSGRGGFIPGSIHTPYRLWRSSNPNNPGELPPLKVLQANVESLGLNPETSYVIVFAGNNSTDFGSAARVYWTLKYLGFKKLAVLNGGLQSYRTVPGVPWTQTTTSVRKRTVFTPRLQKQYYVGTEEVNAAAGGRKNGYLIDSRPDVQFQFSTITGSKQLWQGEWFVGNTATLKDMGDLKALASRYKIPTDTEIFVYCNTGHWAASNWFVLSEVLGYPNVKLYPDSLVGYSQLENAKISRFNFISR